MIYIFVLSIAIIIYKFERRVEVQSYDTKIIWLKPIIKEQLTEPHAADDDGGSRRNANEKTCSTSGEKQLKMNAEGSCKK